jgi:dimethylargininase
MQNRRFSYAIVRPPGQNFAEGLTTLNLGQPDFETALGQHAAYCAALQQCGVELVPLPADLRYPDSTFVEDVAVLTPNGAVLTRPGADSRRGEIDAILPTLGRFFPKLFQIQAPATLDGGDVCEAGDHFFIGLSERTNKEGARQLADFLTQEGCTASFIPLKGIPNILHLKSGLVSLGERTLVAIEAFAGLPELADYTVVRVSPEEAYAANCLQINDAVLIAAGYPLLQQSLADLGFNLLPLAMSEFQKMDGGLSCLSLRF